MEWGRPDTPGQVTGGRWKPIHHWLRDNLFTDYMIACGVNATTAYTSTSSSLLCFVKNDLHHSSNGHAVISVINLSGAPTSVLHSEPLSLSAGPGSVSFFSVPPPANRTGVVLRTDYVSDNRRLLASNLAFLAPPYQLQLQAVELKTSVADRPNHDGSINVTVSKSGQGVALFVTLTTRAEGRFSRNAFLMEGRQERLTFEPWVGDQVALLATSLRVEHAGMYLLAGATRATSEEE